MENIFETHKNVTATQLGEIQLIDFFKANGVDVADVTHDKDFFYRDIDLICRNRATNNIRSIEVKCDTRLAATGNLFIELYNPRSKDCKGYYYFCEADLFYYEDFINRIYYVFDRKKLWDYIERNMNSFRKITTNDSVVGLLVPLEELKGMYTEVYL